MNSMEAILSRRSIRKYTHEPVAENLIEDILKAGMNAPSAGNEQPWHFVLIDDRSVLNEISKLHPYAKMLSEAPLALLVCGDESREKFRDFWVQDCSAATENMLLAAHALGLGAVWLGIFPAEKQVEGVRRLLNIPGHVIPFSIISLGYPAEEKEGLDRYDASRVHRNSW